MRILLLIFLLFLCISGYSQNTGISFSNTNTNYILTPHVANVYPKNNFTVEFWLRNAKTSSLQCILQKGKCNGNLQSWHFTLRPDNTLDFNFDCDGGCSSTNSYKCDSILAWGVCYHIAVTYSATGVKIYYNGQLQTGSFTSGAYCGNLFETTQPLRIGVYKYYADTLGAYLSGMLDEIRIWNRVLTQNEIQTNYMLPLTGNETGLVLYYQLDENIVGPGVVIPNHATLTGSQLDGLTYSNNSTTPNSYNSCFVYTSSGNEGDNNIQLQVYPNPSDNQIILDINEPINPSEIFNVEIFDITGKRVFSNVGSLPMILENENFQKGIYHVKVYNSNSVNAARIIFN